MFPRELAARIRGEYFEMPGLRLTLPEACRLWQISIADCVAILESLVQEQFLTRTHDGAYIAVPMPHRNRITPAKAAVSRWPIRNTA
jgi:hypothetical protein